MKNRHYRILTDDDIKDIKTMYCSGKYTMTEIGEWVGITTQGVYYWVKKLDLK